MIARVHARGHDLAGLLWYLYSPGRRAEHENPRLVGGWRHPSGLEPPRRPNDQRDFRRLTGLMEIPLAILGDDAPREYVWHCSIRAAPGDPELGDGAWMEIAAKIMDRIGLSQAGHEGEGAPWIAVHHGDQHVHLVAVLGRLDGRRAQLHNDYFQIGEALAEIEVKFGLLQIARTDRTAHRSPTRAETEKARAAGRDEPPRATLRRLVHAAAAAARSEPEFWAGLEQRNVMVRARPGPDGQPAGLAVALPGDTAPDGRPVWFGGGRLAADMTLPKLRRRWKSDEDRPAVGPDSPEPDEPAGRNTVLGPDGQPARQPAGERLSGQRMSDGAAKPALRIEVARVAAAARSEAEFWDGLAAAGLIVWQRPSEDRPGEISGYAVSLPALTHHLTGTQMWYGGGKLDKRLTLPALRRRWAAGLPGDQPGREIFGNADMREIYAYAATVAADAARRLRSARGQQAADIAWAAADLMAAAADATRNPELRRAADGFARAGRAPWGRIPAPSPAGLMLRTAAWLLARCRPGGWPVKAARIALTSALGGLARAIADLRARQQRTLQAAAAREAAAGLKAAGVTTWTGPQPVKTSGPGGPAASREAADGLAAADVPAWTGPQPVKTSGPGRPVTGPGRRAAPTSSAPRAGPRR